MNIAYYWIMGICIGIGLGDAIPDPWGLVVSSVGLVMAVGSCGWYGRKLYQSLVEHRSE